MKKLSSFLLVNFALLSSAALGACSNESEKVDLLMGNMHATSVTSISYDLLKEHVDSKENFLVAVQYSDSCTCWSHDAKPILEQYIKEKHVIIYHVKLDDLDAHNNRFNIDVVKGNVSFAIFENGEVKKTVTTNENKTLKDYVAFSSYMESMITLPRMYYVSLDDVNGLYKKNEKNIVYFSRSTCGDCSYLETHYLRTWSKNNPGFAKKIYVLDCDQKGIRYKTDEDKVVDADQWQEFKHQYGLSSKNNPNYGYDNGYVPTMFLVQGDGTKVSYLSGLVVFNDSLEKDGENYKVSNSYFTSERKEKLQYIDADITTPVLKGMSVSKDDVNVYGEYFMWAHEASENYFNPFVEKFLAYCEKA